MDLIMIKVEVSYEFQSFVWKDGAIMMLADILKEEIGKQCIENKNIICNQSVNRTRVEKMCDVAIIKKWTSYISMQKN